MKTKTKRTVTVEDLLKKFEEIDKDPVMIEKSEKFYREISTLSPENLFRKLTI